MKIVWELAPKTFYITQNPIFPLKLRRTKFIFLYVENFLLSKCLGQVFKISWKIAAAGTKIGENWKPLLYNKYPQWKHQILYGQRWASGGILFKPQACCVAVDLRPQPADFTSPSCYRSLKKKLVPHVLVRYISLSSYVCSYLSPYMSSSVFDSHYRRSRDPQALFSRKLVVRNSFLKISRGYGFWNSFLTMVWFSGHKNIRNNPTTTTTTYSSPGSFHQPVWTAFATGFQFLYWN